ncbi:ribonuclease domain-containing protein [Streptomyces sp. BPTC-684]|uniref:ribonuclease domain-containing protein n=1 Tax=Streptomyces sp. BPTC-684 TaxID=3043734 RepID=UPI0024B0A4C3|nr:ribonuclease domain-containing protein [Streptomyces sp. BPTC-684]WHM39201.1 ribonuclease domain-containing protein [Streptomyces sp. BPTC-684]
MRIPPRISTLGGIAALAATLLLGPAALEATASTASVQSVGSICYSDLPSQAYDTLRLIDKGGPFPYSQDGVVFSNREHVLPSEPSGYYHEYTVKTPGSPTRGARRIVTGQQTDEDYYTSDHYATFDLVDHGC